MLVLTAFVAGVVVLYIIAPLLGWSSLPAFDQQRATDERKDDLLRQRQEILAGIKDLDLEYEVGKLTREDYEKTRQTLTAQAVEIYRQMDRDGKS